jgi:hypothetical protein
VQSAAASNAFVESFNARFRDECLNEQPPAFTAG